MKVPRLGVESELQLPAYATATAIPDPGCICDIHHRSCECWILNPLNKVRDRTCILMNTIQIHFHWAMMGTPRRVILPIVTFTRATEVMYPWILLPCSLSFLWEFTLFLGQVSSTFFWKQRAYLIPFLDSLRFFLDSCMNSFWWKTEKSLLYSSKFSTAERPNSKSVTLFLKDFSGLIHS